MGEHADHGPIATHPILLGIAGIAFLVLMALGVQLKSISGHHELAHDAGHHTSEADH